MSYWIYHEIWAKDNPEFNLIEKLQEDGALTNVHESENSYSPERMGTLNLEKIAPKEVEMERERIRKYEEEHHRTVSEEDLRRIGTAIIVSFRGVAAGDLRSDHEEAGLEFIFNYVPNIDYLFGISKKYPDITFNFRIITENGRNLADGYVKNGEHVTNMGKPYGNVFIFKKTAAKFSRDTDEVAINVPILENGEEKSSFVTINAKKEDLLEAMDLGFHDRDNYDRYYAIPFPNADATITYSKYGEQKTVGVTDFRKMHYEARLKYAKEKAVVEFPIERRDIHELNGHEYYLYRVTFDVPTEISDTGKMSIIFNKFDFCLRPEDAFPDTGSILFHSDKDYKKTVSVKKGSFYVKILMDLHEIKKLYQDFQKERRDTQLQSEESRMMEEETER